MRLLAMLLCSGIGFLSFACVSKATVHACKVPAGLVEGHFDWIAENTDYDVGKTRSHLPEIVTCIEGDDVIYSGEHMIVDHGIQGMYDPVSRRIFLINPIDFESTDGQAVLLHELIHAVQFDNREWDCIGQPEWETYKLHQKWLSERGIQREFDWIDIYFQSRCAKDIHPN